MLRLHPLRLEHQAAVLAFEQANRAYFARFINDRGDDFFRGFAQGYRALMDEQESGDCAFYVLVEGDDVVGRFNLYDLTDETAIVGYRLAESAAGRGVATSALRDLCRLARERHGLRTLRAATSDENVASQRVLAKAGFVATGPAEVGGRHGSWYELILAASPSAD